MKHWTPYLWVALLSGAIGASSALGTDLGRRYPGLPSSLQKLASQLPFAKASIAAAKSTPSPAAATRTLSTSLLEKEEDQIEQLDTEWSLGEAFQGGRIITGSTPHRLILFTFDDGPDVRHTPALLDELDRTNVKAVFFLTARRIRDESKRQRQRARIARDIVARGHIIGNHTHDHLQLTLENNASIREEMRESEAVFIEVLGGLPRLFRPPGGSRSPRVDKIIAERGYTSMMWNLGTGDTQVASSEEVFRTWKRVFRRREREHGDRGGIVLLHDIHETSLGAYRLIHAELMRRNCRLLDRGEELYDIVDDPSLFFSARNTNDASALAPPATLPDQTLQIRQRQLRLQTAARCR